MSFTKQVKTVICKILIIIFLVNLLSAFNVGVDFYKMGRQKTIQWGGENIKRGGLNYYY
jgi:hypothetical protein